jgi:hypothetical protein
MERSGDRDAVALSSLPFLPARPLFERCTSVEMITHRSLNPAPSGHSDIGLPEDALPPTAPPQGQ